MATDFSCAGSLAILMAGTNLSICFSKNKPINDNLINGQSIGY